MGVGHTRVLHRSGVADHGAVVPHHKAAALRRELPVAPVHDSDALCVAEHCVLVVNGDALEVAGKLLQAINQILGALACPVLSLDHLHYAHQRAGFGLDCETSHLRLVVVDYFVISVGEIGVGAVGRVSARRLP